MRSLIFILIIASFLETAVFGLHLTLIAILAVGLNFSGRSVYALGFFAGIFLSILATENISFWPIIFLVSLKLSQIFKELPVSTNILTATPFIAGILVFASFLESLVLKETIDIQGTIMEIVLSVGVYFFIRIISQRFTFEKIIRLRMR